MGECVESACRALPCHAGGVQRPWRLSGGHCSEIGRHREGERARGSGLEVRTPTPYSPHRLQERDDADKRDRGVSEHEEEGWEHAQAVPMLGELARLVHAGRRACSRAQAGSGPTWERVEEAKAGCGRGPEKGRGGN